MISNRQLFLNHIAQTSPSPLMIEIESASGMYLFSPGHKSYMDIISGVNVSILGHAHPEILQAVKEQTDKYMHLMVYGELVESPRSGTLNCLPGIFPDHSIMYILSTAVQKLLKERSNWRKDIPAGRVWFLSEMPIMAALTEH